MDEQGVFRLQVLVGYVPVSALKHILKAPGVNSYVRENDLALVYTAPE